MKRKRHAISRKSVKSKKQSKKRQVKPKKVLAKVKKLIRSKKKPEKRLPKPKHRVSKIKKIYPKTKPKKPIKPPRYQKLTKALDKGFVPTKKTKFQRQVAAKLKRQRKSTPPLVKKRAELIRQLERIDRQTATRTRRRATKRYKEIRELLQTFDALKKGFAKSNTQQIKGAFERWYSMKTKMRNIVDKYEWADIMDDIGEDLGFTDQEIETYRES